MLPPSADADEHVSRIPAAVDDEAACSSPELESMPPSSDLALPIGEADMAPSATPVSANMLPADDGLGLIGSEDGDKDDDEDGDASGLDIAELLRRAGVETRGKIVRTTSVPTKPQAGGQSSKAKSPKSKGNAVENVETDRSLAQTRGGQTGK